VLKYVLISNKEFLSDSRGEGSADLTFSVCCVAQSKGEEDSVLLQQSLSAGLHLVPYVDEEPIPLNWSQALVGGESGWPQAADKEVQLIMATSRILGVSCDGHFEKLRAAFALILAGRAKNGNKKPVGGSQEGKV
jgi:hypothetical protein